MGAEEERGAGQRLVHGLAGALLAGLSAIFIQFWLPETHWWVVGVAAALGFLLAWFAGEAAIEFLKSVFRWS
jgi:hypothetical protein